MLRALGAVHVQECPEGVPDSVREKWPAHGAFVLTNEDGNAIFYSLLTIPPFSTEWGVGGPVLFDKERISLLADGPGWVAGRDSETLAKEFVYGIDDDEIVEPDPVVAALVAACRALVLSKLGEVIQLISGDMVGTPTVTQGPPR